MGMAKEEEGGICYSAGGRWWRQWKGVVFVVVVALVVLVAVGVLGVDSGSLVEEMVQCKGYLGRIISTWKVRASVES